MTTESAQAIHHPLPPDYLDLLMKIPRIKLAIMGKDPYPSDPVGIPFCKPDWVSQFKGNCSGGHVLMALGVDPVAVRQQYATPQELFHYLAKCGIAFLNLSYHFIGKPIAKSQHSVFLQQADRVNSPILDRADNIILCGEAKKIEWYGGVRAEAQLVCHPDNRNRINPVRSKEWGSWWSPNALKGRYALSV